MGLSPILPNDNVIGIIIINTVIAINIFKGFIQRILNIFGIHLSSLESESMLYCNYVAPKTMMDEFREQVPPIRFGSVFNCKNFERDCLVCLTRFHRYSMINHLHCGHVFHIVCLEKWLDQSNFTCPLCRTCLKPKNDPPKQQRRRIC
ncbi:hypothetical protein AQUCO_00400281v1 [Aquilegia coerulea]|uniref:RING-type domain-containing protein n=1 Tax=Aquilegia coerulea TaxID=218851 RepID=A0A2G5EU33_AQUCA|nr:hypothetical protein AQUCO_00400281v1 [Aquilegia coerulea]